MRLALILHLVLGTATADSCTDRDIGLSLSTKYQTRVAEEAAALHANGGQCYGCCDDTFAEPTGLVYGNCSVDLPLLALSRGTSLHKACSFLRTALFLYTGSTHLQAFMSAMEADVPAGMSGNADLVTTWCGFTCVPGCAGHPPSSPPVPHQSDQEGSVFDVVHVSTLDSSLGWVAWLWVGLIATQAVVALLAYVRHRCFLVQLRAHMEWARKRSGQPASAIDPPAASAGTTSSSTRLAPTRGSGLGGQNPTLALPPPRWPVSVSFRDVSYRTPKGAELIAGLTGDVSPGELIAIMGESGSGKTTCLSVLAGRAGPGRVGGQIYVNGELRVPGGVVSRRFAAQSGYMLQSTGAVCNELSARENLSYAALLRLPPAMPLTARLQRVDDILAELQLSAQADQRIGRVDDSRGGLSGGERRRLMLAIQLLTLPSVLVCDEATSGLDARSAQQVTKLLRGYARTNRSVVMSVHQPRAESFVQFDRLLLVHAGRIAFCGAPLDGLAFISRCADFVRNTVDLNSVDLRSGLNPADVLLDLLSERNEASVSVGDFAVALAESHGLGARSPTDVAAADPNERDSEDDTTQPCSWAAFIVAGVSSLASSLRVSLVRLWVLESRLLRRQSRRGYSVLAVQLAIFAAILGSVYWDAAESYVIAGQLYKLVDAPGQVLQAQIALLFYDGLSGVYVHERSSKTCSPALLLLQYQVHFVAWVLPPQLMFAATLYLCTFQPANASALAQTMVLSTFDALTYVAFFCAICAAMRLLTQSPSMTAAVTACAATRGIFSFFSGYFLSPTHTSWLWRWLFYLSPTYYSFSAIFKVNFASVDVGYLALYSYDAVDPSTHAAILFGMWAGYLLLAWLLLATDAGAFTVVLGRCTMAARHWSCAATRGSVKTASSDECATQVRDAVCGDFASEDLLHLWYGKTQSNRPMSACVEPPTTGKAQASSEGRLLRSSSVEAPTLDAVSNGTHSISDGVELRLLHGA